LLRAVVDCIAFPKAMAEPDPRVAVKRLVSIFFANSGIFNSKMLGQIIGASVADPLLERGILARNERAVARDSPRC